MKKEWFDKIWRDGKAIHTISASRPFHIFHKIGETLVCGSETVKLLAIAPQKYGEKRLFALIYRNKRYSVEEHIPFSRIQGISY